MSKKSDVQVIYETLVAKGYINEDMAKQLGCQRSLKQRIHDLRTKYGVEINTEIVTKKKRRTGRRYQMCERYTLMPRKDKSGHKRPYPKFENLK